MHSWSMRSLRILYFNTSDIAICLNVFVAVLFDVIGSSGKFNIHIYSIAKRMVQINMYYRSAWNTSKRRKKRKNVTTKHSVYFHLNSLFIERKKKKFFAINFGIDVSAALYGATKISSFRFFE